MDTHTSLCDHQHGSRSQRLCNTQLIEALECLSISVNIKQCDMAITELGKTFDTVWNSILYLKLDFYNMITDAT